MAIYTIQFKRGKASSWVTLNPVLLPGEPGFEIDTGKIKIGNGVDDWETLKYVGEDKELIVTADTRDQFPPVGDASIIYKASQENQLYQWNKITSTYELLIDLTQYVTQEELKNAIDNIEIPELALEDYATKAYTQDLFGQITPLSDEEINEICK